MERPQLPRELEERGWQGIKQVVLHSMSPKQRAEAENEVRILSSLCHPNIIRYEETFIDKDW
eukprot:gene23479-29757_t